MKIESKVLSAGCALAALAVVMSVQAGSPIRTGLWEEITTVKRDADQPRSVTIQNCLTEEDVSQDKFDRVLARIKSNKSCQLENYQHSDRATSTEWKCAGQGVSMHGKGELVYDDSTHFHMSSEDHTTMSGRSVNTNMSVQSRWLSSDCGKVKPLSGYSAK